MGLLTTSKAHGSRAGASLAFWRGRLLASLPLAAVALLLAGAAPASAGTTEFKAQFVCNDRGAVYPLANARVELRERGQEGEEVLPRWLDPTLFVTHADAEGRVAVQFTGPEENWRGKDRSFYFRIVLTDNAGVRAEEWWAPWAWFADTATNNNDVPVQDYRAQGLGNGAIPPECAAFEGSRRAYHGYAAGVGSRPPYELKVNVNSPSAGVPFAPWIRIQWPPRYPTGNAPGGSETTTHEFAHTLRHAFDGGLGHFFGDVKRFDYLQQHQVCKRTNPGFAFNEGWAAYWARDFAPAPNCPGKRGDDYAVEGNVAAALDSLDRVCRGVGWRQMVEVLRRNRGRIHSFGEFRSALGCQPDFAELPRPVLKPNRHKLSLKARIRFGKLQLKALKRSEAGLERKLRRAARLADQPNPCRPKPCVAALIREIRPALLTAELKQSRLLRATLAFQASKRGLRKLGAPESRRFQQRLVARARSFATGVTEIGARAARRALSAARPYLKRGGAPVSAIGKGLRAALGSFRAGRLPAGYALPTPAGTQVHQMPPAPDLMPPAPDLMPPAPDLMPPAPDLMPPAPDLMPPAPDLMIEGLYITWDRDGAWRFYAEVRNAGNASAAASKTRITQAEEPAVLVDTPALAPGARATVSTECVVGGLGSATALADATDLVAESNEANNGASVTGGGTNGRCKSP